MGMFRYGDVVTGDIVTWGGCDRDVGICHDMGKSGGGDVVTWGGQEVGMSGHAEVVIWEYCDGDVVTWGRRYGGMS